MKLQKHILISIFTLLIFACSGCSAAIIPRGTAVRAQSSLQIPAPQAEASVTDKEPGITIESRAADSSSAGYALTGFYDDGYMPWQLYAQGNKILVTAIKDSFFSETSGIYDGRDPLEMDQTQLAAPDCYRYYLYDTDSMQLLSARSAELNSSCCGFLPDGRIYLAGSYYQKKYLPGPDASQPIEVNTWRMLTDFELFDADFAERTRELPVSGNNFAFSADSRKLYYTRQETGNQGIFWYDLTDGSSGQLPSDPGSIVYLKIMNQDLFYRAYNSHSQLVTGSIDLATNQETLIPAPEYGEFYRYATYRQQGSNYIFRPYDSNNTYTIMETDADISYMLSTRDTTCLFALDDTVVVFNPLKGKAFGEVRFKQDKNHYLNIESGCLNDAGQLIVSYYYGNSAVIGVFPESSWKSPDSVQLSLVECQEDDTPIMEIASELYAKTGITLHYNKEALVLPVGDYTCDSLDDKAATLDIAAIVRDFFLSLPDGLISEALLDGKSSLSIYICGNFYPRYESGITTAAALTNTVGDEYIIALGGYSSPDFLPQTLAHEFMHIMEERIEKHSSETGTDYLEIWRQMFPEGFSDDLYFDSYNDTSGSLVSDSAYTTRWWQPAGFDPNQIFFVDSYSRSYPMEDRARFFEYLYLSNRDDSIYENTFAEYPWMIHKAQYLCWMLRECFPSIEETPYGRNFWETHLEQAERSEFIN